MRLLITLTLLALLTAGPLSTPVVWADGTPENFYCNPNRPDDSGAGTSEALAKKTLQAAVNLLDGPGDVLYLMPGVYPIYETDSGGKKIIANTGSSGFDVTWKGEGGSGGISGTKSQPVVIKAQRGLGTVVLEGNDSLEAVSQSVLNIGSTSGPQIVSHFVIEGIRFIRSGGPALKIHAGAYGTIRNCEFIGNLTSGILVANSHHIRVESCKSSYNLEEHGYYFSNGSDDCLLINSYSFHNASNGMQYNGDPSQQNAAFGTAGDGLCERGGVYNSVFYNNGQGTTGTNALGMISPHFPNPIASGGGATLTYSPAPTGLTGYSGSTGSSDPNRILSATSNTVTFSSNVFGSDNLTTNFRVIRVTKSGKITQYRPVASNTGDTITITGTWQVTPDNTWAWSIVDLARITDTSLSLTPNEEAKYPRLIKTISGTGSNQVRIIRANSATTLWLSSNLATALDTTTSFHILHAPNDSRGAGSTFNVLNTRYTRFANNLVYNEFHKTFGFGVNNQWHPYSGGTGTITGVSGNTITFSGQDWTGVTHSAYERTIRFAKGGSSWTYTISSNTSNTLTVSTALSPVPDSTYTWNIIEQDEVQYYTSDNYVVNNTCITSVGSAVSTSKGTRRTTVKFNIFRCAAGTAGAYAGEGGTGFAASTWSGAGKMNTANYNMVTNTGGSVIHGYNTGGSIDLDWAEWQAEGQDVQGFNEFPDMVRPLGPGFYDLRPTAGSRARYGAIYSGIYFGAIKFAAP